MPARSDCPRCQGQHRNGQPAAGRQEATVHADGRLAGPRLREVADAKPASRHRVLRPMRFESSPSVRRSRDHLRWPAASTCLAGYGLWIGRKKQVRAEMLDEVFASLVAGGGEAGEDFPGSFATFGLVATGELPGDHGWSQRPLGPVVGSLHPGVVEEGEQPSTPLAQTVGDSLLVGIVSRRTEKKISPIIEMLTDSGELGRRQVMAETIQSHGGSQQTAQLVEERSLILRFSIARLGNGLEMMAVTLMHDKGQVFVAGQTITDQHAAEMGPQGIQDHILAPALFDTVDRSIRRSEGPQPAGITDPPTGFVGIDGRLRSQSGQQFEERTFGFVGHTMHRLGQSAGGDAQSAERLQHPASGSRGQAEMFVEQGRQSQRPGPQMNLGRPGGGADLHRVRAAHFTASRTIAHIGEQMRHVWPCGREVFDELFAGLDVRHWSTATRTTVQTNLDMIVNLGRFFPVRRWMARFASRFAVFLGGLAVFVFTAEWGGLSRCLAFQLFDTLLQLLDKLTQLVALCLELLVFPRSRLLSASSSLMRWSRRSAFMPYSRHHDVT